MNDGFKARRNMNETHPVEQTISCVQIDRLEGFGQGWGCDMRFGCESKTFLGGHQHLLVWEQLL